MKFGFWNDIVCQSSYFKSQPDLMTLGGVGGGKPKVLVLLLLVLPGKLGR